eukprot:gene388-biopygen22598
MRRPWKISTDAPQKPKIHSKQVTVFDTAQHLAEQGQEDAVGTGLYSGGVRRGRHATILRMGGGNATERVVAGYIGLQASARAPPAPAHLLHGCCSVLHGCCVASLPIGGGYRATTPQAVGVRGGGGCHRPTRPVCSEASAGYAGVDPQPR